MNFIDHIAEKILERGPEAKEMAVILPNRRTALYIKRALQSKAGKALWLPEFFSIDQFYATASGFSTADPLYLSLELYEIHIRHIPQKDQRPLEDFLGWAPMIIRDFNDIDLAMADSDELFNHLSANKAIQEWNPDGSPLTPLQQQYLDFYHALGRDYEQLRQRLTDLRTGYPGLICRHLVGTFDRLQGQWPWKSYLVAGINALSEAELRFFQLLKASAPVTFLWDVDRYYYSDDPSKAPANPDPGRFIRQAVERLKLPHPVPENALMESKKTITMAAVQGNIIQTKYVAQWLEKTLKNGDDHPDMSRIAIVPGDESLLPVLLSALPVEIDGRELKYNVTMGYELRNSHFEWLLGHWATLLLAGDKAYFPTIRIIDFINQPLISDLLNSRQGHLAAAIKEHLTSHNITGITRDELAVIEQTIAPSGDSLLARWLAPADGLTFIRRFAQMLEERLSHGGSDNPDQLLERQKRIKVLEVTHILMRILHRSGQAFGIGPAKQVMQTFIKRARINLMGEPLEGIQVLGLLETRGLDFDHVLLLSANEGVLPADSHLESIIPMDIRHRFRLPLPKDSQDVTAYHFYGLLQRSATVEMTYNNSTAGLGAHEKSRFLLQTEHELARVNPGIHIVNTTIAPATGVSEPVSISIPRTAEVLAPLHQKAGRGLSPSGLNSYIACPLRFYFRYSQHLYPADQIEEYMQSNTYGSLTHAVLEDIYTPFIGKQIDPEGLHRQVALIPDLLMKHYRKQYGDKGPPRGKNLLLLKVAEKTIGDLLATDMEELKAAPRILLALEKEMEVMIPGTRGHYKLKGVIDRVDRHTADGSIRIIDYKSGSVSPSDLVLKTTDDLLTNTRRSKAFQLICYALLYRNHCDDQAAITTGNWSLRSIRRGVIPVIAEGSEDLRPVLDDMEKMVSNLFDQIFDPSHSFSMTDDQTQCTWCDYKAICNRK